jgi:putative PIN family toxin of toxin-antitoxin system
MRVFFDTNVLVSAFTSRGLCNELFKGATVSCTLVVSSPLLAETRRILLERFKVPREYVDEAIAIVEEDAVKAPAASPLEIAIKDRDDILILSSVIHGKADFFVTGDKEVIALGNLGPMRILTPRDFWFVLRAH